MDYFIQKEQITHSSQAHMEHSLCHFLGYKIHLNKFKGIEIIQCLLSDHNGIQIEIKKKKIAGKSQNTCRF